MTVIPPLSPTAHEQKPPANTNSETEDHLILARTNSTMWGKEERETFSLRQQAHWFTMRQDFPLSYIKSARPGNSIQLVCGAGVEAEIF